MPNTPTKLAIAFDFESADTFWSCLAKFEGLPIVAKLGMRLLPHLAPGDYKKLVLIGHSFFVDAKLLDIPTQVAAAARSYAGLGADYLTVHLSGGSRMLKDTRSASKDTAMRILGVSVLTSFDDSDLNQIGVERSCGQQVQALVDLAIDSGISSFVSSVGEVRDIKQRHPQAFCVCPGIRLEGEAAHSDQRRSFTPKEAKEAGADMIVVGRSILNAENPRDVAQKVLTGL